MKQDNVSAFYHCYQQFLQVVELVYVPYFKLDNTIANMAVIQQISNIYNILRFVSTFKCSYSIHEVNKSVHKVFCPIIEFASSRPERQPEYANCVINHKSQSDFS